MRSPPLEFSNRGWIAKFSGDLGEPWRRCEESTAEMKPYREADTRKSRTLSQARLLVKSHLHWFDGFPVKWGNGTVSWCIPQSLDAPNLTLDGVSLSRAVRAIHDLRGDFAP